MQILVTPVKFERGRQLINYKGRRYSFMPKLKPLASLYFSLKKYLSFFAMIFEILFVVCFNANQIKIYM